MAKSGGVFAHPFYIPARFAALLFALWYLVAADASMAESLVIMHRAPDSLNDKRQDYNTALIKLALSKTLKSDETLELKSIPPMNSARARYALNTNLYPNLILELSYSDDMRERSNIDYVSFPIDLGALSYRTCFVSPNLENSKRNISSLDDLRSLSFVVGVGWPDFVIYQDNALNVVEINYYDNIFKMLTGNRFDLFCRGASEILNEYRAFNSSFNLHHNKTFALHYQLPRFFFVHATNQALKHRLEKGLKLAYEDGSLKSLWQERFAESIKFSDIKSRKMFELDNKRIQYIDKAYEKYMMPLSAF